jgi:hypothetical protein
MTEAELAWEAGRRAGQVTTMRREEAKQSGARAFLSVRYYTPRKRVVLAFAWAAGFEGMERPWYER